MRADQHAREQKNWMRMNKSSMRYEISDLLLNSIPSDICFSCTSSVKKSKRNNYTPIQLHMIMIMARITFYLVILLDELDCISWYLQFTFQFIKMNLVSFFFQLEADNINYTIPLYLLLFFSLRVSQLVCPADASCFYGKRE